MPAAEPPMVRLMRNVVRGERRVTLPTKLYGIDPRPRRACLLCTLRPSHLGYCKIHVNGRYPYVHRFVWERTHGPIHAGLELDHLCRTANCIELAHLDLVTHAENMRRMALWSPKACPRGHTGEFVYVPASQGRRCLACHRERERQRTASRRARALAS